MPFEYSVARAFSLLSIRAHAPSAPGVYGISNAREWIYIGRSDNIQNALMHHLTARDPTLAGRRPTGFAFEVCEPDSQAARCERLIVEYAPVCNPSTDR